MGQPPDIHSSTNGDSTRWILSEARPIGDDLIDSRANRESLYLLGPPYVAMLVFLDLRIVCSPYAYSSNGCYFSNQADGPYVAMSSCPRLTTAGPTSW